MINKPINPSPHNCCVDIDEDVHIKYEIPNAKIDGCVTSINDLDTGSCVLSQRNNYDEATNQVNLNIGKSLGSKGEYSWDSFYWQTPVKAANTHIVSNIDVSANKLFLKPDGKHTIKKTITYKMDDDSRYDSFSPNYYIESGAFKYSESKYTNQHTIGDDTSEYCYKGQLEDYFGFDAYWISSDVLESILEIGVGKCIIEVYNDENKLSSRARVLAYDKYRDGTNYDFCIVDNEEFEEQMLNSGIITVTSYYDPGTIYKINSIAFYNIDDLNSQEDISGLMSHEDSYYLIRNSNYINYHHVVTPHPSIPADIKIGDEISVWSHEMADFNTTPTYYFRAKTPPDISVNDYSQFEIDDDINYLRDIQCKFGLNYSSLDIKLNYYYLYLYVLNPKSHKWEIKERSPMLYNTEDTYEFKGLANGQEYKVYAVCTDSDGDEWTTDEIEFAVETLLITSGILANFNKKNATIELFLKELLSIYTKYVHLEFYRVLKKDINAVKNLEYAGEAIGKIGELTICNKWNDYNIKNNSYYDYYIRVNYTGKQSDEDKGVDIYHVNSDIYTNFEGTSILSLEKTSNDKLAIKYSFNLLYHFDSNMNELTYEISRDYINSFSKYPKELKGHQNYITSSCSGLLGSENNGIYEEPKDMRAAWSNFVNDDSIKLYRGLDGETMIISIETSKIKPYNYPSVGLVNEVHFTFKEIASADTYAIFTTEIVGD